MYIDVLFRTLYPSIANLSIDKKGIVIIIIYNEVMMPRHGRGFGHGGRCAGEYTLLAVRLIEPALLSFLAGEALHGYTLLEKLEALGLGNFHPSAIYRVLRDMEDVGWVTSSWDREQTQGPPRRVYALSADGRQALQRWQDHLQATQGIIEKILNLVKK